MRIEAVTVTGAGVMGAGIAQTLAVAGCRVRLYDVRPEALETASQRIERGRFGLARAVERGKLSAEDAEAAVSRIEPTADAKEAYSDPELVLEAVPEDLALKVHLFQHLDREIPAGAILASNTSGFPIAALAAATGRAERVIGWHWASPAPIMTFAEIVVHERTAPDVRDAVVELARRCGKNPQVVHDQPLAWGFVANRIFLAAAREAERIVAEGVAAPEQVDALVKDCFGWPAGPFEIITGAGAGWEDSGDPSGGESQRLARQMMPFLYGDDPPERRGTP